MTARMAVVCVVVAMLAGCATADPIAIQEANRQAEEAQAYGPIHQSQQQRLAKIEANRAAYIKQVGPSYPYLDAVKHGVIVTGMTAAAVDAAGYSCDVKEHSDLGPVEACTNMKDAFSIDGPEPPPYYVGFDNDGTVVSVQNP